jgi:hypothetical protein
MASAFQSNTFQRNGFQIAIQPPQLIGWGAIIGRRKKRKKKRYEVVDDEDDTLDLIAIDNDFILLASD